MYSIIAFIRAIHINTTMYLPAFLGICLQTSVLVDYKSLPTLICIYLVLMLLIFDVFLFMVITEVIHHIHDYITNTMLLFSFFRSIIYILFSTISNILISVFRPKNAANGILFGEVSHPGPVDNFLLHVHGSLSCLSKRKKLNANN